MLQINKSLDVLLQNDLQEKNFIQPTTTIFKKKVQQIRKPKIANI
jgi:hypothetical protein